MLQGRRTKPAGGDGGAAGGSGGGGRVGCSVNHSTPNHLLQECLTKRYGIAIPTRRKRLETQKLCTIFRLNRNEKMQNVQQAEINKRTTMENENCSTSNNQ